MPSGSSSSSHVLILLYSNFNMLRSSLCACMGVTPHLTRDAKQKDRWHPVLPAHAGTAVHLVSSESRTPEAATQPQWQRQRCRGELLPSASPMAAQTSSHFKRQSLGRAKASAWLHLTVWKGTRGPESWKGQLNCTRSLQWSCEQKLIKV